MKMIGHYKIGNLEIISGEQWERYIEEQIQRNIERKVMKEIGYGPLLFDSYHYEAKEQSPNVQTVSIEIAYTRLTEIRVGNTWGCKLTKEKGSKKFIFKVTRSEIKKEYWSYLTYTLERKL